MTWINVGTINSNTLRTFLELVKEKGYIITFKNDGNIDRILNKVKYTSPLSYCDIRCYYPVDDGWRADSISLLVAYNDEYVVWLENNTIKDLYKEFVFLNSIEFFNNGTE